MEGFAIARNFLSAVLSLLVFSSKAAEPEPEKITLHYHGGKSDMSVSFTRENFEVRYHAYMTKDANLKGATPPEDWATLLKAVNEKDFLPRKPDGSGWDYDGRVILTDADKREVIEYFTMNEDKNKSGLTFLKLYHTYMTRACAK